MIFTPGKRKRQIFQTVANNKEERGGKSNLFCPKPDQAPPPENEERLPTEPI